MRELQPKLQELQNKYKDNPQELNNHMIKLYREHDINPLVDAYHYRFNYQLFGHFYDIAEHYSFARNSYFLGLWDLTLSAKMLLHGCCSRAYLFVVTSISCSTIYLQTKQTATDPKRACWL